MQPPLCLPGAPDVLAPILRDVALDLLAVLLYAPSLFAIMSDLRDILYGTHGLTGVGVTLNH